MRRAIVTVRRIPPVRAGEYDLDVPAEIPVSDLVNAIALALNWGNVLPDGTIAAGYLPRVRRPDGSVVEVACGQSLADIDAWDGTVLECELVRGTPRGSEKSLVQTWSPLTIDPMNPDDVPIVDDGESLTARGVKGYVLKQVD